MSNALNRVNFKEPKKTAQTEKAAPGQKQNNAGGFVFKVSNADRFRRFLTIGTDGGTYYVGEQKLTEQNVKFVQKYIAEAGVAAVEEIVNVSTNALAPKNTQALFALALALSDKNPATKAAAKAALPKVARTATHLYEFMQFVENTSGWGRAKTTAVSNWVTSKTDDQLAFQAVKYRQRNGWKMSDVFRLVHPRGVDQNVGNFILGKPYDLVQAPEIIQAFHALQNAKTDTQVVKLLNQYPSATWEMIPTEFLNSAKVWRTLFEQGMGQTALLRNTKRMHELGLFSDLKFAGDYAEALSDPEKIQHGRLHPINYLNAYVVYAGDPDSNMGYWGRSVPSAVSSPNNKIVAALEAGYHAAFKNVVPAKKRTLMGLDVSGSMSQPANGLKISCATLGAAFSQTLVKREPYAMIRGFARTFKDLGITDADSLKAVMKKTKDRNFGTTDTALPMEWALSNKVDIDTFVIFTDNETYGGQQHTFQALDRYRQATGIPARLVVVGATATKFTVADPNDVGSLDVSGFDSSAPKLIADFSAGRL